MQRTRIGSFTRFIPVLAMLVLALASGCAGEPAAQERGPLMVAGFENATGQQSLQIWDPWLSDMLIRDLWQAQSPVVWPLARTLRVRKAAGSVDREAVLAAAGDAGAGSVLFGRVTASPEGFLLTAELVTLSAEGDSLNVEAGATSPLELPAAIDQLRDALWAALAVETVTEVQSIAALTTENTEAYGEFIAGEIAFHRHGYIAAEQRFRRAAELDVDFAQAHYRRATARMRFALSEDEEVRSAITLAWAKRGHTGLRDRLAIEALRALVFNETQVALDTYTEVRSRFPGDRELAYYNGLAHSRKGELDQAGAAFAAAIKSDPRFLAALTAQANTLFMSGDPGRALAVARQGLDVNPVDPGLLDIAVNANLFLGDLDEAGELLERGLSSLANPTLALSKANMLLLRGDVEEALAMFLTLRSPFSIAIAEMYSGRVNAALSRLSETSQIQIAGGNPGTAAVALWFTAMVLEANGAADTAFLELTKAVNLAPDFPDAMVALGALAARTGDTRRASQTLATIREWGADVDESRWRRQALYLEGELAMAEGDHEQAVVLLQEARTLAGIRMLGGGLISDRPLLGDSLGRAYLALGDVDAAEEQFKAIVAMSADRLYWPWLWLGAHTHLAELAVRDGRMDDAQAWAAVVRDYWGEAGPERQAVVDDIMDRLELVVPVS